MRALLATSIGVAAAGALLLSLAPTEFADSPTSRQPTPAADLAHAAPAAARARTDARTGDRASGADRARHSDGDRARRLPGRTQSLPLGKPADRSRSGGRLLSAWQNDPSGGRRITTRHVRPFSLLGVVWNDVREQPRARLQMQTRDARTGRWTGWRPLNTRDDDRPDPDGRAHAQPGARGATAPVWVGGSDAVRVRVQAPKPHRGGADEGRKRPAEPQLPAGTRLELVDPGPDHPGSSGHPRPQQDTERTKNGRAEDPEQRPGGVLPALDKAETRARYGGAAAGQGGAGQSADHIGPRPAIVTRKGWGADESLRQGDYLYTDSVKAAFVHHSAESNNYSCSQSPAIVRGIYRYHVLSSKWRDIGYNFLVDKCGKIYEGRAGGVAKPVMGAHTFGFNNDTTGIAVLGTYSRTRPSKAALHALARLTAWKLGVHGVAANAKVSLVSGGGTKYRKGTRVSFNSISGHRDGYVTDCPGDGIYDRLGSVRTAAARLQGR